MIRETRNLIQGKQQKIKSANRAPSRLDGSDGDMLMYNGVLYIKDGINWYKFYSAEAHSDFPAIDKLIDDTGGTASNTLSDVGVVVSATEHENAMATLGAKINQIINKLGLHIK